jgi:plastocyanin
MNARSLFAVLTTAVLVLSACSADDGDDLSAAADSVAPTETVAGEVQAAAPVTEGPPVTINTADYFEDAQQFAGAPDDRSLPQEIPEAPAGAYGYSRYVFQQEQGEIVPTLIEGPQGRQVRCQALDQDCSRAEMQALFDSGEEIPEYLGMDRETLGELLDQLAITEAAVNEFNTIEEACESGMRSSSSQNPNMGIHMQNPRGTTAEFDPARPQMILYAKEGGELIKQRDQGNCVDGEWTGETGYTSVGAVFTLPMTEQHPDAFAGPIDNWHIHLNTCAGSPEEGGQEPGTESGSVTLGSRQRCEASGGFFMDVIPTWMMHAYVDPEFDAQGGVFAMFNPSIWPLGDPSQIRDNRTQDLIDSDAVTAPILNFDYGDLTVKAGDTVVFTNSDSVPHTVTAGAPGAPSGQFDSGVFGTGQAWETTFEDAGEYELFCVLHPGMTSVITVE